ncbi:MAG: metal ABC transporter substrate-binding protein [Clostridiales bacterium]|nr:metal ABC transporter substrate-binding protein [Clostridiales bacterium]
MKKFICIFAVFAIITLCFSGCNLPEKQSGDGLNIITTVFPAYDFARNICGDNATVTQLLPPGAEAHTYEPAAKDIVKIQNCDLFIFVGGESDAWADKILSSFDTPVKDLRMMECVNVLEEELKEGMDAGNERGSEEKEYDEHVWTSPLNAIKICEAIRDAVCEADPDNRDIYTENCEKYVAELTSLDNDFKELFKSYSGKPLIFGDRFPLRYFVEEYGLDYYAAFPGCSAQTEPSAATLAFLTDKIRSENIKTVFYIEFSNHTIADSLANATGAKTAQFNTCHNISQEDLANGATYISLMRDNLRVIKESDSNLSESPESIGTDDIA